MLMRSYEKINPKYESPASPSFCFTSTGRKGGYMRYDAYVVAMDKHIRVS
jgi:hypothetical protein